MLQSGMKALAYLSVIGALQEPEICAIPTLGSTLNLGGCGACVEHKRRQRRCTRRQYKVSEPLEEFAAFQTGSSFKSCSGACNFGKNQVDEHGCTEAVTMLLKKQAAAHLGAFSRRVKQHLVVPARRGHFRRTATQNCGSELTAGRVSSAAASTAVAWLSTACSLHVPALPVRTAVLTPSPNAFKEARLKRCHLAPMAPQVPAEECTQHTWRGFQPCRITPLVASCEGKDVPKVFRAGGLDPGSNTWAFRIMVKSEATVF
jgi:hypothetical protein